MDTVILSWPTTQIAPVVPRPVRTHLLRLLGVDIVAKQKQSVARVSTTTDSARTWAARSTPGGSASCSSSTPSPPSRACARLLAIIGEKDLQVDPADLDVIAATVPGPVDTVGLPDLTHLPRRDPAARRSAPTSSSPASPPTASSSTA